jgi:hypothetical protein
LLHFTPLTASDADAFAFDPRSRTFAACGARQGEGGLEEVCPVFRIAQSQVEPPLRLGTLEPPDSPVIHA